MIAVHVLDHLAAALVRRHLVQEGLPAPQCANPGRATHLVPGEGVEVAPERLNVDGEVGRALGAVQDVCRVRCFTDKGADLPHRIDRAEGVRHVGQGDDPGSRSQQGCQVVQVELSLIRQSDVAQPCAATGSQQLPWDQVGMVLHLRNDDLVAVADAGLPDGESHEVQRLAGPSGPHDLVGVGCVDPPGDPLPASLVGFGGPSCEFMNAAMDVRVIPRVVGGDRVDDLAWLLGRSGAVEVYERLPVDGLVEDGEVRPDRADIELRTVMNGSRRRWRVSQAG